MASQSQECSFKLKKGSKAHQTECKCVALLLKLPEGFEILIWYLMKWLSEQEMKEVKENLKTSHPQALSATLRHLPVYVRFETRAPFSLGAILCCLFPFWIRRETPWISCSGQIQKGCLSEEIKQAGSQPYPSCACPGIPKDKKLVQ